MQKLIRDDRGASAISYALIAGIVSLGIVAGLTTLVGAETDSSGNPSGILGVFYSVRATLCAVPAQACSP